WTAVTDLAGVSYILLIDNDQNFSSPIYAKTEITDNWHSVENEIPDGRYFWAVIAVDGFGNTGTSEKRELTIDTSPPPPPSLISPENNSFTNDTTPTFMWSNVFDFSGVTYVFQLDNDSNFGNGVYYENSGMTESSLTLPSAIALSDNTYYWRVRAIDSWGYSSEWSTVFTFTVDTQPLTQASLLLYPSVGENTRDTTPTFEWSSVDGAAKYELWIDNDSDFTSPTILEDLTTTHFTPSSPLMDGVYYWRVRAIDAAGNLGNNWSDTWWVKIDNTVVAPVLSMPLDGAYENDNTPTFSWMPVSDASPPVVYRLQISLDPAFTQIVYDNRNITQTSVEIENQLPENVYYWRVWARDNLGNENYFSSRQLTIDVTPPISRVDEIYPYWKRSHTFTITATVEGLGLPAESGIVNGGFENGLSGWSLGTVSDSVTVTGSDGYATPYLDNYMLRLGTPTYTGQPIGPNVVYQTFIATGPYLSFAHNIFTYDYTGYDNFYYLVRNLTKNITLAYYSQTAWGSGVSLKSTGWRVVTVDLSAYLGDNILFEISAGGTRDMLFGFWAYVDNVPASPREVERVELWYRYSMDNLNWSSWKLFDNDNIAPWAWNFTSPEGEGYYQFYTVAVDYAKNVEPVN
ncbi:MAG: Ig-like domain-containing protein, partial [Candidatus Hadarchaeales archaeon]